MQSYTDHKIENVTDVKSKLGEGPVWDSKSQSIFWLDIENGLIHEFNTLQSEYRKIQLDQMVGVIALCTNGHFIAGLQQGIAYINRLTGHVQFISKPEKDIPDNRFNDGKCDPSGRFWAGTMSLKETKGAGNLYMLNHDEKISMKITKVSISNGLAWSLDKKSMYYIDTFNGGVVAFDYNDLSGEISNPRFVVSIPDGEGYPDGMTIDNEGMLWIAHWGGWQVSRWNPQTGKQLLKIKMPAANITSCTFGGEHLQDLYITSSNRDVKNEDLHTQPLAGSLFLIRNCGYTGLPAVEFKH